MSYPNVVVMFDRKKRCAKTGKGKVEIVVNFSRTSRKYIAMGSCSSADLPNVQNSSAVLDKTRLKTASESLTDWSLLGMR